MDRDPEDFLFNDSPIKEPSIEKLEDRQQQQKVDLPFEFENNLDSSQILPDHFTNCLSQRSVPKSGSHTKGSSRRDKNKSAAQRYREKRKAYAKELQTSVENLENQIKQCQTELNKAQDKLKTLVHASKTSNEHSETFTQLSACVSSEEPDLDKINLLMDTLKYRIGANGRERQAKIDYYFKQIVNTIFPAVHRYLMQTSMNKRDIFSEQSFTLNSPNNISWANQLFKQIDLKAEEAAQIKNRCGQKLIAKRTQLLRDIVELIGLKQQLKDDEEVVEDIMAQLRKTMHPVQSAQWILFCDRHKYRRQISWEIQFEEPGSQPRKRIKTQQSY